MEYRGRVKLAGHFAKPGDTESLAMRWRLHCDRAGDCVSELGVAALDQPVLQLERTLTVGEASWRGQTRLVPAGHEAVRRLVALAGPESWATPEDSRAVQFAHPRLGDTTDAATYGDRREIAGRSVPVSMTLTHHDVEVQWTANLKLHSTEPMALPELEPPPPLAPSTPVIEAVRPGLWRVDVHQFDARSLIVESTDRLVVLEAPWSSAVGESVVDLATEKFGGKPIDTVAFSHHHPHYTGGLRAMLAAGATVVAPPGNAQFVRAIADRGFSLEPDRWARRPQARRANVVAFEGETTIGGDHRVVAIDIGAASNHTAEYVVFWIPSMGVLVEADLGWYTTASGELRASGRAGGLLDAIDARKLPVEEIVQVWPVVGATPSLPFAQFRALVTASRG